MKIIISNETITIENHDVGTHVCKEQLISIAKELKLPFDEKSLERYCRLVETFIQGVSDDNPEFGVYDSIKYIMLSNSRGSIMKTLNIQIRGVYKSDLVCALGAIRKQVKEGFLCGVDCNNTGSYTYGIVEEDEERTCLIKGCENKTTEGFFEGKVCVPCYEMLISGQVGSGNTFIHELLKNKTKGDTASIEAIASSVNQKDHIENTVMENPTFVIKRFPEGITINPPEYILDSEGEILEFESEKAAVEFLNAQGIKGSAAEIEENFGIEIVNSQEEFQG